MSSENSKQVRTELSPDEYERLREFARERGLSVEEAGQEAMLEWIERHQQVDREDRAFTVLDDLQDPGTTTGETDAREEDDLVEEWTGDDAKFTLADDPSPGE